MIPEPGALAKLERLGKALEDAVLVILLGAMIALAAGQILLRNVFDAGFFWTDELLRMLVLWLAVAGGIAASRQDRHIAISVLDRLLPARGRLAMSVLTHGFTATVSGLIAWHGLAFVRTSHEFGDTLLGDVPAWIPQAVLPIGFALIAWRFAVLAVRAALSALRSEPTS